MRILRLMMTTLAVATAVPVNAEERPRLIVQITFDQLRGDLLWRYRPAFSGGFARLLDQGWWVRRGEAAHGITVSWPGHATLATGLYPSRHGFNVNEWWIERDGKWTEADAATDRRYSIVSAADRPGKSLANLNGTTIGDWVKASSSDAKIVAIGSDAALPYVGRRPDGIFWFNAQVGGFTTSTNYASTLPDWVKRLNVQVAQLPREWALTVPARFQNLATHPQRCPPFQAPMAFPNRFKPASDALPSAFGDWLGSTPLADEALLARAGTIVRAYSMGADDSPDYLALAIGATDSVGHDRGPLSLEQLDTMVRLDRALGTFLDDLDRTVGKERYVLAVSADHGSTDPPENGCGHRVTHAEIEVILDRVEAIAIRHRGSRASLVRAITAELRRSQLVGEVYSRDSLARAGPRDWRAQLMKRSAYPGRTPSFPLWSEKPRAHHPARYGVWVTFKPGMIFDYATSVHGSPEPNDRLVPVIFYGAGVPRRTMETGARTVDVAPTLAALAGVTAPAGLDGRVLIRPKGKH